MSKRQRGVTADDFSKDNGGDKSFGIKKNQIIKVRESYTNRFRRQRLKKDIFVKKNKECTRKVEGNGRNQCP